MLLMFRILINKYSLNTRIPEIKFFMTSISHQQITTRNDFSGVLSPFFISYSIFSSIKSPSHGAAVYIVNQQAQFVIDSSFFSMCKCQGNQYSGGSIYAYVKVLNSSRVCNSFCYSYDNGASYSFWSAQSTSLKYTAWSRCGEQGENTDQDSCIVWDTKFLIEDSNSSHNYVHSQASSMGINSNAIGSEVLFSTFMNNSRDSSMGSLWMQGVSSRVSRCNFIRLSCVNAIIVTDSSYGSSTFEYCSFQSNQGSHVFSKITSSSVLNVMYCVFDLSTVSYIGISLTLVDNLMSSTSTQEINHLSKIVCNNEIMRTHNKKKNVYHMSLLFTLFM